MASGKFITVRGITLHYLDFGNPRKPPLICLHGLTGNAHNFDNIAPILTPHYHLMSLDIRGRGDSEWGPPGEYDIPHYVFDLKEMIDQLGLDRVTLIGTSMGGIISILLASAYPKRVERLVINDIGPEANPAGLRRIAEYVGQAPTEFDTLDEVTGYYREHYAPLASADQGTIAEWIKGSIRATVRGTLMWKMDPSVRIELLRSGSRNISDLWIPYARISQPTLIIRGSESDLLSRRTVARMCGLSRATRSVEVPGVGHAPLLSEPAARAALIDFLKIDLSTGDQAGTASPLH
jgi:pimeloyl-ACP methyl ester carboxylesterase